MPIKRVFVEKKPGFDVEAQSLFNDLTQNLNVKNILRVRILNCYDIEGLDGTDFEDCKRFVLSEPPVDSVCEEIFRYNDNDFVFSVKYLPGQYDQRADSAAQCIQTVTGKDTANIETSKFFVIEGGISDKDREAIKKYCINPVDSMEYTLKKPESLKMKASMPGNIKIIHGFITKSDAEIKVMRDEMSLAMSTADLMFCRDYFRDSEKRDPTLTEIMVIDTYWSDHCRHTTFLTSIPEIEFEDGPYRNVIEEAFKLYMSERENVHAGREKDVCLMDLAVMGMKSLKNKGLLRDLDESEEINACSITVNADVDGHNEEWLVMFKNETHNHPTEIEPFGGAATCLGGAIRDPLSGRSFVYQAMRVTGSGNPLAKVEDTLQGKLPQRKITQGAAAGYSSYGNQIGLATGIVHEIYDDGYIAKRMEIGAVIGAVRKDDVVRERPCEGDVVILVGGRTGRDGCGGATGSSKEHNEQSLQTCGAEVQKGNSPTERKLQRLFRNPGVSRLIKRCNDFGAGGVSVAIGELADGLDINLDAVPKKYDGLDGTELAISESQERMAVAVSSDDALEFIRLAGEENLEATVVANVTDSGKMRMFWRNELIVDLSRSFLNTNGVRQTAKVFVKTNFNFDNCHNNNYYNIDNLETTWLNNLENLNVSAQKGLSERFDSTVGAGTILMPFGGKYQLTPSETMAAKLPVISGKTKTATLMSFGYNPIISKQGPFHGAILAVVESVSKIVAAGGEYAKTRLTFQEYFERLGTDPERWGKPFSSLLGAFYAQMKLGIPSIGGKDSMSGTFKDMDVPPTLVSFAVNVTEADNIISNEFKKKDSMLYLLETPCNSDNLPDFDRLIANFNNLTELIRDKKVISAHTIGIGGIAAVLSKMAFGGGVGFNINFDNTAELFIPKYGSFILETVCEIPDAKFLGTTSRKNFFINGVKIEHDKALKAWLSTFEPLFPTNLFNEEFTMKSAGEHKETDIALKPFNAVSKGGSLMIGSIVKMAKPRVLIPVFPGTNGEYDAAVKFEEAGASVEMFVVKNLNVSMLEECITHMSEKIRKSQMIMFPGGFSAGDEPDGAGKFISAVFRNSRIKDAVETMLNRNDGLILGICNGFQALIKLGLVPYGEIREMSDDSPTLTFNTIGRHISCLARTKIISNLSPWLAGVKVGSIHTLPVSHGEGRFVANEETIRQLVQNGQIATQYVDFDGNPTYDIMFNPNGSMYAIEGITSPDGRILGKMGHSERVGDGLLKNVPGDKDQRLFESGVKYFQ